MSKPSWIVIGIVAAVAFGASCVGLSAPVSVQVSKGQTSYASNCASCHGQTLAGGFGPPLKGAQFLEQWSDKSARSLYGRILTTMPASAPGTLPPKTVVALTIYLLSQNGVDLGKTAKTSAEQLSSIVIKR